MEIVSVFLIKGQPVFIKTKVERDAVNNYYRKIHNKQEFTISSNANINQSLLTLHGYKICACFGESEENIGQG